MFAVYVERMGQTKPWLIGEFGSEAIAKRVADHQSQTLNAMWGNRAQWKAWFKEVECNGGRSSHEAEAVQHDGAEVVSGPQEDA